MERISSGHASYKPVLRRGLCQEASGNVSQGSGGGNLCAGKARGVVAGKNCPREQF